MSDDRQAVERFYDGAGEKEWARLEADLAGRVSFEIHRRFLARFVQPGMRVLEIGCGGGRFTIELVRLGCRVVCSDISLVQLESAQRHVGEAKADSGVERWLRLDVCDLSGVETSSFDAVVAYGGPLSYAFEQAGHALDECLRVVRPGGFVVASVMSLLGNARHFLGSFPSTIAAVGADQFDAFLVDGDQRLIAAAGAHPCRMFMSAEIRQLVSGAEAELLGTAASNWLSLGSPAALDALAESDGWDRFLDWEERMCNEPGAIDGGTHLLFAARKST